MKTNAFIHTLLMGTIKNFIFNAFQVNTYLLYDESLECIIVDAACYEENEKKELRDYIAKHKLQPVRNINTHCHIDHFRGSSLLQNQSL